MLEVHCTVRHKIWTSAFGLVFFMLLSDHLLWKCISSHGIPDQNIDLFLPTFMWQPSCWAVTSTSLGLSSTPLFLAQQQHNLLPAPTVCIQPGGCVCSSILNHCLELSSLCCYIWKGDWAEVQKVHSIVGIGDPKMKLKQRMSLQWSAFGYIQIEWKVDIMEVMGSFYPPCFYKWTYIRQESRYQV